VTDFEDFRDELTDALADELHPLVVGQADRDLLRLAVRAVTAGWTVRKRAVIGPDLPYRDDVARPVGERVDLRFYEITTPPRRLTPKESGEEARRRAVWAWRYGPDAYRDEPPDGVDALALLEQDRWWVTGDRRKLLVRDMHPKHRANTLAMLRRNAAGYFETAMFNTLRGADALEPPDAVVDAWERSLGDERAAAEWLKGQPLVRKLRRLVRRDAEAGLLEGDRVVKESKCD